MTTAHPTDERLGAWIDDRLTAEERQELELHLETCSQCRRLRDALVASRDRLRTAVEAPQMPAGFESRILAALDEEDARQAAPPGVLSPEPAPAAPSLKAAPREAPVEAPQEATAEARPEPLPFSSPEPSPWRRLVPLATAAAALLALVWLWGGGRGPGSPVAPEGPIAEAPNVLQELVSGYEALSVPELPQALKATSGGEVEARWEQQGVAFPARVFELAGMGIEVAGGDASPLGGQLAARSIYRGGDETYVCWMLAEAPADLPPPAERRYDHGIEFLVYQQEGKTLVLWKEGEVFCAFVGDGDPETVISLAIAKAMLAVATEEA